MEENLLESRENFQRYFNMSTVGMCVTSPDKHSIETNRHLRQMLGYSAEELDDLTWNEITHPNDVEADLALYNQILADERDSYQMDKRFIRKDGAVVYTTLFATCHRHPDGTVRYLLASLVDVTDRKQAKTVIEAGCQSKSASAWHATCMTRSNQSIHGLVLFSETLVSTLQKNNMDRARQIAGRLQKSAPPGAERDASDVIRDANSRL